MNTLLDIWDEPETSGVFTVLNNYSVPWKDENSYESLNLAYYYNHSGQKNISPLVSGILGTNTTLTDIQKTKIGKLLYDICAKNWQYEYDALFASYDPIENYNSVESETINEKGTKTGTGSTTSTGTDTTAKTGDDTLTRSGTDNRNYSGTDTIKESGTDTFTDSGSDSTTNTGTNTLAYSGTDTKNNTGTDTFVNTGDDITKNTGTVTDENVNENGTSKTVNQIYGYNTADPADDSTSEVTVNQTITDTRTDDTISTLTHGLNTEETQNLTESVEYGKTETDTKNLTDTTNYGKSTEESKNMSNSTTYGRIEAETIDITEKTDYNNTSTRTLNLAGSNTDSENTTGDTTRELSRHGNIGVTTSQQMIESELELRKKFFYEIVFRDIDQYLTLAIY